MYLDPDRPEDHAEIARLEVWARKQRAAQKRRERRAAIFIGFTYGTMFGILLALGAWMLH